MRCIIALFACICSSICFSQSTWYWFINFDDGQNLELVNIDQNIAGNTWQAGTPMKTFFSASFSSPHALVTDTINPYPANNLSRFLLRIPSFEESLGQVIIFTYKVDSDSLMDEGMISISFDKGSTWQTFLELSQAYLLSWNVKLADYPYTTLFTNQDSLNPFTGRSNGWYRFYLDYPAPVMPWITDTVYYRFDFQSDGIHSGREGWMIDDILGGNLVEGTGERTGMIPIMITPNPVNDRCRIVLPEITAQKLKTPFILELMDVRAGKILEKQFTGSSVEFDNLSQFPPGIYWLTIRSGNRILGGQKLVRSGY